MITARLHALLNGQDGALPAAGAEEAWYQPALSLLEAECADPDVQSILKGFSDPGFSGLSLYPPQLCPAAL